MRRFQRTGYEKKIFCTNETECEFAILGVNSEGFKYCNNIVAVHLSTPEKYTQVSLLLSMYFNTANQYIPFTRNYSL